MASSDLLKRMEALNGGPLANALPEREDDTSEPNTLDPIWRGYTATTTSNLAAILNLDGSTQPDIGHFEIVRPITAFIKGPDLISARVRSTLEEKRFLGHSVTFLDLETLGLKNEPLILIGTLEFDERGSLLCRQQFARDLTEEASVVQAFAAGVEKGTLLVTFNGITFDEPFLRRRAAAHGIRLARFSEHYDVLAASRMKLAGQVRDFRLKTLESRICGRRRTGDIPGGQIPGVYTAFQRSGDATSIVRILEHNALDLITTADLFTRL